METQYQLTKRQELLRQAVRDLAQKRIAPRATDIDRAAELPKEVVSLLSQTRLLGLVVPREYGGEGAGFMELCLALEELNKVCSVSALLCANQNLVARLLLAHGSDAQKKKYLPPLASGRALAGLALDEAEASLDAGGLPLKATKDGDNYLLNGSSSFLVNGDAADTLLLFATTEATAGQEKMGLFVLEKETSGLSLEKMPDMKGGEARYTSHVQLKSCRLSRDNVLGEDGAKIIVGALGELGTATAARAVGLAQGALEASVTYAKQRVQFGRPIGQFQAIQLALANMETQTQAARYLVYKAASLLDQGDKESARFGAIAKSFATDVAMNVATDAVQVHGGYGYMKEYPIERLMRNAKLAQLADGGNQIHQFLVAKALLG